MRQELFAIIKESYLETIEDLPKEFDTHDFIRKLIQKNQGGYIDLLIYYRNHPTPFMTLHGNLARMLADFPEVIQKSPEKVISRDIFGNLNKCTLWQKIS